MTYDIKTVQEILAGVTVGIEESGLEDCRVGREISECAQELLEAASSGEPELAQKATELGTKVENLYGLVNSPGEKFAYHWLKRAMALILWRPLGRKEKQK